MNLLTLTLIYKSKVEIHI